MTDTWQTKLCAFTSEPGKCLLSTFCFYVGIGLVQGQGFDQHDRGRMMPCVCSTLFCCLGAGYNRSKTRKYFKIKGSFLIDCLLYTSPLCCCAATQEFSECKTRKESILAPPAPKAIPLPPRPIPEASIHLSFQSMDMNEGATINSFPDLPEILILNISKGNELLEDNDKNQLNSSRISEVSSEPEPPRSISSQQSLKVEVPREIAILPLDGNNPLIYSMVISTGPFSYLKGEIFQANSPPPTYLTLEFLKSPKPVHSKEIMQGLEITKNGGLMCVDKEAIAKQKGIISEVFKSVVSNITSGLGAVSISLPVRIFEPRSTCERLIDRFSFATKYLTEAGRSSDPVHRLKLVMAFALSGLYLGTKQEKPFNPLLGETFQGHFADGTEIYVEHTAHNPPTDHFDVIGRNYRLYGYYSLDGKLSMNSLTGEFSGATYVQFYDGQVIRYTQPKFILGGTMFGDRTLNWEGDLDFTDSTGLSAAIRIGDDKHKWAVKKKSMKKDSFVGKIWRLDQKTNKRGEVIASAYGSWLKKFVCVIGGQKEKLWVIDREIPDRHIPVDVPIPGDWRYREDLLWLARTNLEHAAAWKLRLESRQRADRMLRGQKH